MTVKVGEPCPTCGYRPVITVCDGCGRETRNVMPEGWITLHGSGVDQHFCGEDCVKRGLGVHE